MIFRFQPLIFGGVTLANSPWKVTETQTERVVFQPPFFRGENVKLRGCYHFIFSGGFPENGREAAFWGKVAFSDEKSKHWSLMTSTRPKGKLVLKYFDIAGGRAGEDSEIPPV